MSNTSLDFEAFGGSYLLSNRNYELYVEGAQEIGRPDGQFMIPSNQMNELLAKFPDNPREWEQQLGLGNNSLGDDDIHRVDVYHPQDFEPRLPSQNLSGANDKFIPGGKTPGGQDECVINQFPNPENNPSVGQITTLDTSLTNSQSNTSDPPNNRDASLADFGLSASPQTNNSINNSQAVSGGMM